MRKLSITPSWITLDNESINSMLLICNNLSNLHMKCLINSSIVNINNKNLKKLNLEFSNTYIAGIIYFIYLFICFFDILLFYFNIIII